MIRRLPFLILAAALLLPACRDDGKPPKLSPGDEALLREKADEKIGILIRENVPALFAGVVVFRSDAFITQSAMLDRQGIPVLNVFGKAAIVRLNGPEIPVLLQEGSVKKIFFLCRPGALARFDPTFEMDLLRRFGEGREMEPVSLLIRFRDVPKDEDARIVEAAGFTVNARAGYILSVAGPLASVPRLLELDEIVYYEGASRARPK